MGMVEKVARSLHDAWLSDPATIQDMNANGPLPSWEEKSAENRARFYKSARAALDAMREPTEEMLDVGHIHAGTVDDAYVCFTTMIDAALKE